MEKVGERLVEERKRLAKTVAGMAEECAVSKQAQINFEKGRQLPGGAYLIAAARLGVDVSYVLTGQRAGGTPSVPALDAAEQVLLDSYRRCGATAKQNLIQTAALLSAGLGGSGVATVAHATGGVSQSNVHGSNHFVAGDSATSMPTKRRAKAA